MKEFFDTSVLVAAFLRTHPHHEPSIKRFAGAERQNSACAIHTLAELYSAMTALPVKPSIPPEQTLLFVQEVRNRLAPVSLDPEEYFATIEQAADRGLTSGRISDALLLACAANPKRKQSIHGTSSICSPSLST